MTPQPSLHGREWGQLSYIRVTFQLSLIVDYEKRIFWTIFGFFGQLKNNSFNSLNSPLNKFFGLFLDILDR